MDSNDLYPNSGALFQQPAKQRREQEDEINDTLAAIPLLREIIDRLDERIAFYGSINCIPSEAMTNPEVFMHIVAANKLTIENLDIERSYILERVENVKK